MQNKKNFIHIPKTGGTSKSNQNNIQKVNWNNVKSKKNTTSIYHVPSMYLDENIYDNGF